jgi:hypothetical protein
LRVCSKQATAETLGVRWTTVDLEARTYPPHCYTIDASGDVVVKEEFRDAHLYEEYKKTRVEEVAKIKVTTKSGKTFDGDEKSQDRMARAVALGSAGETTQWKLADNSIVTVTWEELREALRLAGDAQTAIWVQA